MQNNFDSTVRVRAYEPTPYLPSRYFDLQDSQSAKSLAQIYEEEYQAQAAGGAVKDPRDEKLKKEHEEIDKLWGEICYKLDALSSLNFVPKQVSHAWTVWPGLDGSRRPSHAAPY
jgi:U3 small nucleolar RNA-associated protein MPP10